MRKVILTTVVLSTLLVGVYAQELNYCGTHEGKVEWLKHYQANPDVYPGRSMEDTIYVPLTIHIVGDDNGNGFFALSRFFDAFCTLNNDFKPSAIQFYVAGDIRYISNSAYYNHDYPNGYDMMENNNVSLTVNCYIVDSPAGNCGYSVYDLGVALSKGCMDAGDHTWAHELGHQLSLPHTFYGWEGIEMDYSQNAPYYVDGEAVERVDGVNCNFASDGFCDTPPDYLNFRWTCNADGMSSIVQHDPYGESFQSDGTLFMSYSNDECAARFSDEQIGAMRSNLLTERAYLLYNQTPPVPITENELVIVAPENDSAIDYQEGTQLMWEPIAGAELYVVDVSVLPTFSFVLLRYFVDETQVSIEPEDLLPNKNYYWRVRPFNRYDACVDYAGSGAFNTFPMVSSQEREPVAQLSIQPNPVSPSQSVTLQFGSEYSQELLLKVFHSSGQLLEQRALQANTGLNSVELDASRWVSGVYLLQIAGNEGITTRKIVVQ